MYDESASGQLQGLSNGLYGDLLILLLDDCLPRNSIGHLVKNIGYKDASLNSIQGHNFKLVFGTGKNCEKITVHLIDKSASNGA
jgi:hypothetical protein